MVPHAVISPYVTWTSDPESWGLWGATFGGTYVGHTRQTVPGPIVYPSYVALNASGFAQWDVWEADANVNNLGDERYFTPGTDTYANLSALPGIGRISVEAIGQRDYPVIQGTTILLGVVVVIMNLLTDILYQVLDPRIQLND